MVHVNSSNESFEITRQNQLQTEAAAEIEIPFTWERRSVSFRKRNARPAGDSSQVRKSLLFFVTKASRVEWTQKRNRKFIQSWKFGRAEICFRYQTFDDSSGNFLTCNWTHITRKTSRRVHTIVQVTQFASNFLSNTQKCLANRKVIFLQNWISNKRS